MANPVEGCPAVFFGDAWRKFPTLLSGFQRHGYSSFSLLRNRATWDPGPIPGLSLHGLEMVEVILTTDIRPGWEASCPGYRGSEVVKIRMIFPKKGVGLFQMRGRSRVVREFAAYRPKWWSLFWIGVGLGLVFGGVDRLTSMAVAVGGANCRIHGHPSAVPLTVPLVSPNPSTLGIRTVNHLHAGTTVDGSEIPNNHLVCTKPL